MTTTRFPSFETAITAKQKADTQRQYRNLSRDAKQWVILAKIVQALQGAKGHRLRMTELEAQVIRSRGFRDFLGTGGLGELLRIWSFKIKAFKVTYSFFDYPQTVELVDTRFDPTSLWRSKGYIWHPQHVFSIAFEGLNPEQAKLVIDQFSFETPPAQEHNVFSISDQLTDYLQDYRPTPKQIRLYKTYTSKITQIIYGLLKNNEKVYNIGSWDSGLALTISPIDLCIVPKETLNSESLNAQAFFSEIQKELYDKGMEQFEFHTGRTTTLKFIDPSTDYCFQIHYGSGSYNTLDDLLVAYAGLSPIIKDLLLIVKLWSYKRSINDGNAILSSTSYQVSLLGYLISLGAIPNLQATCINHTTYRVPSLNPEAKVCTSPFRPANCCICNEELPKDEHYFNDSMVLHATLLNQEYTIYNLLMGYFKFIATQLDPVNMGISLVGGGIFPRLGCQYPSEQDIYNLPNDSDADSGMASVAGSIKDCGINDIVVQTQSLPPKPHMIHQNEISWDFISEIPMFISDPIQTKRNLVTNLSTHAATGILWEMQRAYMILKHDPRLEMLFLDYTPIPQQLFIEMGIYPAEGAGNEILSLTIPPEQVSA